MKLADQKPSAEGFKTKCVGLNYAHTLTVYENDREVLIGSTSEPIEVGSYVSDTETWENGSATYQRYDVHTMYIVRQHGKPVLIDTFINTGDFAGNGTPAGGWEAYNLPSTMNIDRS